jgi:hypothetical protein
MGERAIDAAKAGKRATAATRKKARGETTPVLDRNGGMHRQKQFRRIKAMLTGMDTSNLGSTTWCWLTIPKPPNGKARPDS